MTMFLAPYTAIADIDGSPLDAGFIYFGEFGKNPETHPIPVYWDADFAVPAAQPIRTRNGYPIRNGSPCKIYLKQAEHSLIVKNKNLSAILVEMNNKGISSSLLVRPNGQSVETSLVEINATIGTKASNEYVDNQLDLKAPKATTYTKIEVDSALALKAPQATTYTKAEVDTTFAAYVGGRKAYTTLALAQAEQSSLPANTAIEVTNDPTASNNGTYQWNGTTLTKSAYDPLRQTIAELDKMRGSVIAGENLNIYRREGSWGIASNVVEAGKNSGALGYPSDISVEFSELRCSKTHLNHITQTLTQQSGIWMRLIGSNTGVVQVNWFRIVDSSKHYLQNITLTANDNLDNLDANLYSFSSTVLEAAIDAGDKNYPSVNRKTGGGQIVVSSLSSGHQIQTIVFSQAAAVYTRQKLGSVFTEWVVIGDQKTNYVSLGEDLKTYTKRGTWGIASNVVEAGKASNLGYPTDAVNAFAELSCSQTHLSHTTQLFTQQDGIWMRLIGSNSGNTQIDWIRIVDRNKKIFENYTLESSTDLNTVRTEGIYAFTTTTLNEVIDAGNTKNYPAGLIRGLGGGHLIVSKVGNFPVQTIIFARQARVFSRQLLGSSFTAWVEQGNQKVIITHGSSSLAGMRSQLLAMTWNFGGLFVGAAQGGQIMEGMEAYQESRQLKLSFNDAVTTLNTATPVTLHYDRDYTGSLAIVGVNEVTLSNGLRGTLDMNNNTFTSKNAVEVFEVGSTQFNVDFGYAKYSRDAIHIFNVGKNNLISGGYTAQDVINSNKKMIDHIDKFYNRNFIIIGHYNNNNFTESHKLKVATVNSTLKQLYCAHYLDTQDYLMSSQIWVDLNITPTESDLTAQSNDVLALSLSKDAGVHLSDAVNALIVEKIRLKLVDLGYF